MLFFTEAILLCAVQNQGITLSCFYLPISHLEINQLESHVCHKRDA